MSLFVQRQMTSLSAERQDTLFLLQNKRRCASCKTSISLQFVLNRTKVALHVRAANEPALTLISSINLAREQWTASTTGNELTSPIRSGA